MSENAGTEGTGSETEGGNAGGEQQTGKISPEAQAEIDRLRGELKKFRGIEDRIKSLRPKAEAFDKLRTEAMSEQERATQALNEAQKAAEESGRRADEAERKATMLNVAVKHKIPEQDLVWLSGIPADELEARAADLAKRLHKADTPGYDAGARTPPPAATDMATYLRTRIDQARKRG